MSIWSSIEVSMVPDKNKHISIRKLTKEFFEGYDHKLHFMVEEGDYVEFSVTVRDSNYDAFNFLDAYRQCVKGSGKIIECQIIIGME